MSVSAVTRRFQNERIWLHPKQGKFAECASLFRQTENQLEPSPSAHSRHFSSVQMGAAPAVALTAQRASPRIPVLRGTSAVDPTETLTRTAMRPALKYCVNDAHTL